MAYDDRALPSKTTRSSTTKSTTTKSSSPAINPGFTTKPSTTKTTTPNTYRPSTTPTKTTATPYSPGVLAKPNTTSSPAINPVFTNKPTATAAPKATYTPPNPFNSGSNGGSSYATPTPVSTNNNYGYTPQSSGGYSTPTTPSEPTQPMTQETASEPIATFDGTRELILDEQQQQQQAQAITSVDSVMQGYQQLAADARSMGNEGLVALAAQWDKMVSTLDAVESQITNQIKGQMNGDDPAMQNAIKLIRAEADKMRAETLDELNARGLVQSGVYARALADMNSSELTQIQTAVTSRFSDLQTQLNNAVMSLAQTRISALAANQNAVTSMITNTNNNVLSTGLAGMNAAVTVRGQDIQNNQFGQQMDYNNKSLSQNQSQYDSTLKFNQDQSKMTNQQFYDQLSQANKQFYDQLSQNEKLALISSARSGSGGGSSLDQQKFDFTVQQYKDGLAAGNQANTYNQIGTAMQPGGIVEQMIGKITSGAYTVGQARNIVSGMGLTSDANYQILQAITSDAGVQKKINTGTSSGSSYSPVSTAQGTAGGRRYTPPDSYKDLIASGNYRRT